ncbi:MAG TPA: hypothetical protein VFR81_16735 [Longimicrobium sp.]|nr:hypothetical protein [Longimicrobium sp.]
MRQGPAIRPVFRVLAWILGPPMMLAGVLGPAALAWSLVRSGGEDWMEMVVIACVMAAGIPYGFRFLQAARTGRDPYGAAASDDFPD